MAHHNESEATPLMPSAARPPGLTVPPLSLPADAGTVTSPPPPGARRERRSTYGATDDVRVAMLGDGEYVDADRTVPTSPALSDPEVLRVLTGIGFSQYAELFQRHRVGRTMLKGLSNVELKNDLGIGVLRHRREILKAIASIQPESGDNGNAVPEFGRILVHLSNVRTFHSWLRNGVQQVIFALAIVRLAPPFRPSFVATRVALFLVSAGVAFVMYGVARYLRVRGVVDAKGKDFQPDMWGTGAASVLTLGTAGVALYLLLMDGFVPM